MYSYIWGFANFKLKKSFDWWFIDKTEIYIALYNIIIWQIQYEI